MLNIKNCTSSKFLFLLFSEIIAGTHNQSDRIHVVVDTPLVSHIVCPLSCIPCISATCNIQSCIPLPVYDFHTSVNCVFSAVGTTWLNKDVESFVYEQKRNALTCSGNKKLFELPLKTIMIKAFF